MKNKYTYLIELVVPEAQKNSTRIQFTDQAYLRGAFIYGLEVYTVNDIALTPEQNPVITGAMMKKAFLTLYTTNPILGRDNLNGAGNIISSDAGEFIQQIPLSTLHTLQNSGNDPFERWPFELNGQSIIWEKSFITLGSGLGQTGNISFLLNVNFEMNPRNTTN